MVRNPTQVRNLTLSLEYVGGVVVYVNVTEVAPPAHAHLYLVLRE